MALVTIVGYPCSGKSRRAAQLKESFQARLADPNYPGPQLEVVIVDDESCHVPTSVYDGMSPDLTLISFLIPTDDHSPLDSVAEKSGRANIFAAVIRSLGPDTITICDSPNYIKGFRYQMYCAAREAHVRVCTVSHPEPLLLFQLIFGQIHVATPPEKCREWHEKRHDRIYRPAT